MNANTLFCGDIGRDWYYEVVSTMSIDNSPYTRDTQPIIMVNFYKSVQLMDYGVVEEQRV